MNDQVHQNALALLRESLRDDTAEFHSGQWEAIEHLLKPRARVLVVQRTGWGKSVVYFIATRLLRQRGAGPTLIISPLLSLMRNQILGAERLGLRATTINSSNITDWPAIHGALRADQIDVLLISPERMASSRFEHDVLRPLNHNVGLLVVDEAHCISDWGHDFRPDYRRMGTVIKRLPPGLAVLATTATANERVVGDIREQLGAEPKILRGCLARPTLRLQNIALPNEAAKMAWLAAHIPCLPGSGIIYSGTIKDSQQIAAWLRSQQIDAHAYWSGLPGVEREHLEQQLLQNAIKVLVATIALGMGFDKPDLSFVIHLHRPHSVIHYYQEVGRAGRSIASAYGILLHDPGDDSLSEYFLRADIPLEAHVESVMGALWQAEQGSTLEKLEQDVNLTRSQVTRVLRMLATKHPPPVIRRGDRWHATPAPYQLDDDDLAALTKHRAYEQARMQSYVSSTTCLMQFLQRELDDPQAHRCGVCAVCSATSPVPTTYEPQRAKAAIRFLRGEKHIIEPHREWPEAAFERWQGAIPYQYRARQGRALSIWGDAGWGDLVRRGKQQNGYFDYTLVAAVVLMVKEQWQPWPFPTWVTCVPSLNHAELVPTFARRVAASLGLPFVPAVRKIRTTPAQKAMLNSFQQAHNLEDTFAVDPWPGLDGPVLLLDDMVDSGWTFSVIAAQLLEAGSGPVYPLALTITGGIGES